MRVLFRAQDVIDLVNDDYTALQENTMGAQRNVQHDLRKKDQKAFFYIHQCMDVNMFEKIDGLTTAKAVWDILVWCYDGDASVKKVKLQSLCKKYENSNMKNNEKVPDYISRMILITNEMKSYGETLSE